MTVTMSKEVFNYPTEMTDPYQMGDCSPSLETNSETGEEEWKWQQSLGECGMDVELVEILNES